MQDLIIACDLETYTTKELLFKLPPVKADSRLKDSDKIKANIEEKKARQIEKVTTNALYSRIACIGYYNNKTQVVDIQEDEATMIKNFFEYTNGKVIVTFNGVGFDMPYLMRRGIINGVCTASMLEKYVNKYNVSHIDLMAKWCVNYGEYISLNELANVLLNEQKDELDFKEIPKLINTAKGREKIKEYCLRDCELTYRLAKKFGY